MSGVARLRTYFICALLLLAVPVSAEGWFDDLRLEIRPHHQDAGELRTLLTTLVPAAHYQPVSGGVVVRGDSEALKQIRDLVAELDRPLDEVQVDVLAFELTKKGVEDLQRRLSPTDIELHSNEGSSSVRFSSYAWGHPNPKLPYMVARGDARLTLERRLRVRFESEGTLELPGNTVGGVFSSRELRLKLESEPVTPSILRLRFRFESPDGRWSGETNLREGSPIVVSGPTMQQVILITAFRWILGGGKNGRQ